MGVINVSVDARKLDDVTLLLNGIKNGVPKALQGAVNDTAKTTVTQISRQIRDKVNIKKRDIDPHIKKTFATLNHPTSKITLTKSKRLGLKYFGARAFGAKGKGNKKKAGGVSYQINKGQGRKTVPRAFIGGKRLGGQVFKRVGKKRLPIKKLDGPSPWGVFVVAGLRKKTIVATQELFEKNLDRRVNFLLLKHSGTIK